MAIDFASPGGHAAALKSAIGAMTGSVLISSYSIPSSTDHVDVVFPAGFLQWEMRLIDLRLTSDSHGAIGLRVSADAGDTFIGGGGDAYSFLGVATVNGVDEASGTYSNNATYMALSRYRTADVGNDARAAVTSSITIEQRADFGVQATAISRHRMFAEDGNSSAFCQDICSSASFGGALSGAINLGRIAIFDSPTASKGAGDQIASGRILLFGLPTP